MKEYLKEFSDEHQANISRSTNTLLENGIKFMVTDANKYIVGQFEFYPSSGVFQDLITGEFGKGVFNLIKKIRRGDN
jgi:hypothetical protein